MVEPESKQKSISELLDFVGERLAEAEISHALIGGLAVGLHGYQRATADIDFLVDGLQRAVAKDGILPPFPFSLMLSGASGSGKTNLLISILDKPELYGN